MAIDLSSVQPGPCMVLKETAVGQLPAGFTADTCGFFTIASVNPYSGDLQFQEFIPHTEDFLVSKDIPTFKMARVRLRSMVQGGAAATTAPRFAPLWECAGMYQQLIAATPSHLRWTLATRAQLSSAHFAFQLPGTLNSWVHEVGGLVGNVTLVGTAREGLYFDFDGTGLFQEPQSGTFTTLYTGTWSAGTNNANKFILCDTNKVTIDNGGGAYVGVCKRVEFNLGAGPTPVTDINSCETFGIYSIEHVRFRPTLTIDFGTDTDPTANVSLLDFYQDADDGTTHAVSWTYVDLAGRTLAFSFPTSQVRTVTYAEDENRRVTRVVYKLQGAVPFQIDQG